MMNRIALSALLTMREKVRYMPGLRSFIGFKHDFVEYFREDRKMGRTKMNLSQTLHIGDRCHFFIFEVSDPVMPVTGHRWEQFSSWLQAYM